MTIRNDSTVPSTPATASSVTSTVAGINLLQQPGNPLLNPAQVVAAQQAVAASGATPPPPSAPKTPTSIPVKSPLPVTATVADDEDEEEDEEEEQDGYQRLMDIGDAMAEKFTGKKVAELTPAERSRAVLRQAGLSEATCDTLLAPSFVNQYLRCFASR
jgi:hypothetical protein